MPHPLEGRSVDSYRAPLFIAWQLTNRCRARCLACCEESGPDRAWRDELTRDLSENNRNRAQLREQLGHKQARLSQLESRRAQIERLHAELELAARDQQELLVVSASATRSRVFRAPREHQPSPAELAAHEAFVESLTEPLWRKAD